MRVQQVQFDATIDDLVDVTLRSVRRSKAMRAWRWQGAIAFAGLIGLSTYLIFPGSRVAKLIAGLVAFVFISFANVMSYNQSFRKRVRKLAQEQLGAAEVVRVKVELTESGIKFDQQESQHNYEWSSIETLEETDDAIYFRRRDESVLAVRKRAFESEDSKDQFVGLAKKYIEDHSKLLANG